MKTHFKCKYLVWLACLFQGICIESLGCDWKKRSRDKQECLGDFRCCFRPSPWLDMLSKSCFPSRLKEMSQALQSPPDQLFFLKIDTKTHIGAGGWGFRVYFFFFSCSQDNNNATGYLYWTWNWTVRTGRGAVADYQLAGSCLHLLF